MYSEKVIKGTNNEQTHLWVFNLQLAAFSILIGIAGVVFQGEVTLDSAFDGYTKLTLLVIVMQAFDGLVIALVMKYADNILKGFATSLALVFTAAISLSIGDFMPTELFLVGAMCVILATTLYSLS